jgi:hypothetical protein
MVEPPYPSLEAVGKVARFLNGENVVDSYAWRELDMQASKPDLERKPYFSNFFLRSISRNSTRRIFLEIVLGKLSTNSISRGYL